MNIFVNSQNQAILSIVDLCSDRLNYNLVDDINSADFIIQDSDSLDEIKDFDLAKTLFILPKTLLDEANVEYKISKPFLPTKLIGVLRDFELKLEKTPENIKEINSIINEIDELDDTLKDSKEKTIDDFMPLEDLADKFDKKIDKELYFNKDIKEKISNIDFYLDDDLPLEDFADSLDIKNGEDGIKLDDSLDIDENLKLDELSKDKKDDEDLKANEEIEKDTPIKLDDDILDIDEDLKLDSFENEILDTSENLEDKVNTQDDLEIQDDTIKLDDSLDIDKDFMDKLNDKKEDEDLKLDELDIAELDDLDINKELNLNSFKEDELLDINKDFKDKLSAKMHEDSKDIKEDTFKLDDDTFSSEEMKNLDKEDKKDENVSVEILAEELKKGFEDNLSVDYKDSSKDEKDESSLKKDKLETKDEINQVEVKEKIEKELNSAIVDALSSSNLKEALKELDINIAISFKDKTDE